MSTPIVEILDELSRRGIEVQADPIRSVIRWRPRDAMTPALLERIRQHRPEVLAVLRPDIGPDHLPPGWRV